MKHTIALILCCLASVLSNASSAPDSSSVSSHDVVVYGDSSGAVVAAISAKREGRSVIRNRLLRLTADSPDLLAIIKAEGKV